jgi:DNA-binding CsgD family transcriptional regulator
LVVTASVIGRAGELLTLEGFLERSRAEPAGLVIAGEPGIGKTILWRVCVGRARESFSRVLSCRAAEAEATLSFAAIADLLGETLEDALAGLTAPRRRALEVALLIAEPDAQPPDQRAVAFAFLDVLRGLADSGPVLVAVDDAHWLDTSSARVLQFAFRRLREERVGLLTTVREEAEARPPLDLQGFERLSLGPLTMGALHRLLVERLDLNLTRPELRRLHAITAGNPFFALELGRELIHGKTRLAPGRPLPIPGTLRELLEGRLGRLPGSTRHVLLSAAAMGRPIAEVLAAAHGDGTEGALEYAAEAGVIELDGSRVRFSHPLLAAVCYQHAPIWKRRAAHRRLAEVVSDTEERARHLALAADGPDASIADALAEAAEHAAARGATAAAAELAELSAELTPSDDPRTRRRLLRAADFHCYSGDRERAAAIPERLLAYAPAGVERADVLFALASARTRELPAIVAICEEALAEAGDDARRCSRILAFRSWVRLQSDLRGALADARAALVEAERAGDPTLVAAAIARVAIAEMLTGEVTPGLLERGLAIEERVESLLEFHQSPRAALPRYLLRSGELDRARVVLREAEERAVARGDEGTRGHVLWILIMVEWLAGQWQQALTHAEVAIELAEQTRDQQYRATVLNASALVHAYRGHADEARRLAEEALSIAYEVSDETFAIWSLGVLGHLQLALGEVEETARYLHDLPERTLALGWLDPMVPFWSDALESLVARGELERAGALLESYEERGSRLARPWSIEVAGRCRGLLAGAEGDLEAAECILTSVVAATSELPFPFERARTLLALGSVRRRARQKRAARQTLEQALAAFEQLHADLWAERARAELASISGRRSAKALTESEERCVVLAARGLSNKEIAATLFVSVHTVEGHLSHAYRKLGVRSRAQLAARMQAGTTAKV